MAGSGCCRNCRALTRKNLILKWRSAGSTVTEVLLPLAFVLAMMGLSYLFSTTVTPPSAYGADTVPPLSIVASRLKQSGSYLAVVASTPAAQPAVDAFIADATSLYGEFNGSTVGGTGFRNPALRRLYVPPLSSVLLPFSSEAALEDYIQSPNYMDASNPPVWAAVVFNGAAPKWDYSIRFNSSDVPSTTQFVNTYTTTYSPGFTQKYLYTGATIPMPGFLTIQLLVDRWIIGKSVPESTLDTTKMMEVMGKAIAMLSPSSAVAFATEMLNFTDPRVPVLAADIQHWLRSETRTPQQVDLVPFPVSGYFTNVFYSQVLYSLTLLFVIAYVYPVSRLIRGLVLEKELKLRESLKQMGASDAALWGSWFGTYALLYAILCGLVTAVGVRVFPASNKFYIFILFYLYSLAATAWCFLVSVFFTKSRVAAVLGSIIWVAAYFPFFALTTDTPMQVKAAASLLAPTALGAAMEVLATLETNGLGVIATTAASSVVNNWTFSTSVGLLFFDTILYLFLAWYLDQVLPSYFRDFGVPRPWYFLVTPSYWREVCGAPAPPMTAEELAASRKRPVRDWGGSLPAPLRARLGFAPRSNAVDQDIASSPKAASEANYVQTPDASLLAKEAANRCVAVRGLRKEFSTPDGIKVAVDDLDLTFYEGQITCLLGHNGAGKTTTISMLTGLIPPTSGAAMIYGHNGFTDQNIIRRDLGVCPQHDVLWPELTVNEHLRLFAAIKGVPAKDVDAEGAKALAMVGLTEKADVQVHALSGGMKRKLSVCLAFLGGSRVIFLDEPTSGVDPYSRRSMWSILQNAREGRVIILTTHFMDEAEILGDRIAIMASGKLRCSGTPLFLKEAFGIGYTCTIVKEAGASDQPILTAVREHVPEATIASAAGAELAIRLPMTSSPAFPALLRELDGHAARLGVRTVGMNVTSVEDVFLRIAEGDAATHSPVVGGRELPKSYGTIQDGSDGHVVKLSPIASVRSNASSGTDGEKGAKSEGTPLDPKAGIQSVRAMMRKELSPAAAFAVHFRAIFIKRACFARRDVKAVCCLLLVPLFTLLLGLALLASSTRTSFPSYQLSTAQFNTAGGFGRPGRRPNGPNSGSGDASQYPNYVPAFIYKSGAGQDSEMLTALINAIPSANASTDNGALLLSAARAASVPDPYAFVNASSSPLAADYNRMSAFLLDNRGAYAASKYGAYVWSRAGTVLPTQNATSTLPEGNATTVGIFYNTTAQHSAPIFMNLFNTALLRRAAGITGGTSDATTPDITTRSHPLPYTDYQKGRLLAGLSFGAVQVLLITLSYIPAAFAQFIVREREVAAKHIQNLSGVSLPAYWLSNWAWDVTTYMIPFALILVIVRGFAITDFIGTAQDRLGAFVLLLLGYGGAATSFTYFLSHLFKSPSSAQAAVSMLNILFFAGVIAAFVLQTLPNTCTAVPPMRWSLSIFPMYALGNGLSNMAVMTILPGLRRQCDLNNGGMGPASEYLPYTSAFDMDIAGVSYIYLAAETVIYLALALLVDVLRSDMKARKWIVTRMHAIFPHLAAKAKIAADANHPIHHGDRSAPGVAGASAGVAQAPGAAALEEDPDVAEEARRVDAQLASRTPSGSTPIAAAAAAAAAASDPESGTRPPTAASSGVTDVILINHLRKVYGTGKTAVRDLSFGVPAGEVFGFLGINGAGKTTTLQMLSGDVLPTAGSAMLAGYDIINQQPSVRRLLGYCPQFDALLDLLTVREHLQLFARIKGVAETDMDSVVRQAIKDFDLVPYADKLAGSLSGGNKRKTSVACALVGSPPIVFLDEASTGVDPVARRKLWNIITRVAIEQKRCSIILTTHSMEEVEALCTRIGIMVGGRLRCLGSAQHLRSVHGAGFSSEVRLSAPSTEAVGRILATLSAARAANGGSAGEAVMAQSAVSAVCQLLGKPARAAEISDRGSGWALHAAFQASTLPGKAIPEVLFATWWAEEDASEAVVADYTTNAFPGAVLRERQGLTLKLRISPAAAGGRSLADLFEALERLRMAHNLSSCTLSQTTLEEVFNAMAAQQEEEKGKARGFA